MSEQNHDKIKANALTRRSRALDRVLAAASRFQEATTTPNPPEDKMLKKILRQGGSYHRSRAMFYQRQWRDRLREIGFRVTAVEKKAYHHDLWEIRMYLTLAAQSYLLVCKPVCNKHLTAEDLLERQIKTEIQRIAATDLGLSIKSGFVAVTRKGAFVKVAFMWPRGTAGLLLKQDRPADALRFLIRPWLRRNRN